MQNELFVIPSVFSEVFWLESHNDLTEYLHRSNHPVISFEETHWGDPIPLTWLCIALQDHFDKNEKKVKLLFNTKIAKNVKFVHFLFQQGFYDSLELSCEIYGGDSPITERESDYLQKLAQIQDPTAFPNYPIVTLKMIQVLKGKKRNLSKLIDEIIEEAIVSLSGKINLRWEHHKDYAIQKIRQISVELIENVYEHAYNDNGYVGIYCRLRYGRKHNTKPEYFDIQRRQELENCILLNRWDEFNEASESFWIEMFVVDSGIGICSELSKWKSKDANAQILLNNLIDSGSKYPLKKLVHSIFRAGYSKSKREKEKTTTTGLQLIHEVLKNKESLEDSPGDFVRLISGAEVVAGHLPFERGEGEGGHYKGYDKFFPDGTFYHCCIEIVDETKVLPSNFHKPSNSTLEKIKKEAATYLDRIKVDTIPIDERNIMGVRGGNESKKPEVIFFQNVKEYRDILKEFKYEREEDTNFLFFERGGQHLVWLPSVSATKRDIVSWLRFCLNSNLRSLTIADIPKHRANMFDYIVCSEEFKNIHRADKSKFDVYIITRDWCVAVYNSEKINSKVYSFAGSKEVDLSKIRLERLNFKIRECDSNKFWESLSNRNNFFIKEPVVWNESNDGDFIIDGYLDFAEAVSLKFNYKTIKSALERVLSVFCREKSLFVYLDEYIKVFSSKLDLLSVDELFEILRTKVSDYQVVLIGSTLVSGETSSKMTDFIKSNFSQAEVTSVFVFIHPDSPLKESNYIKVMNWNEFNIKKNARGGRYKRLRGTPFIKRGGRSSYRITNDGYESDPYKLYNEFTMGYLRLGHWEHGNSHDLLSPNLSRMISNNPDIQHWLEAIISSQNIMGQGSQENDEKFDKKVVIYIEGEISKKLVERVLDINPSLLKTHEFHSLQKIGYNGGYNIFFSPVVLERLQSYADKQKSLKIFLIDDAAVSGNTLRRAEVELSFNERVSITTLCVLDRSSYINSGVKTIHPRVNRLSYWKWNVPILGNNGQCKLCTSLDKVDSILRNQSNKWIISRLEKWKAFWKTKKLNEAGWEKAGVDPIKLPHLVEMKFGDLEEDKIIQHAVSTTLTSMSLEISTSTFQNEFSINKYYSKMPPEKSPGVQVQLEILLSNLILLGDTYPLPLKIDYHLAILNLVWTSQFSNPHTALAGLMFSSMGQSIRTIVWERAIVLIEEKGIRSEFSPDQRDLEAICLVIINSFDDAIPRLKQLSKNAVSNEAQEAFDLLISLTRNEKDFRLLIKNIYKTFGDKGFWHRGRFEELIESLSRRIDSEDWMFKNRLDWLINEIHEMLASMEDYDLIPTLAYESVAAKLKLIWNKLLEGNVRKVELENTLSKEELFPTIWEYTQVDTDFIVEFIHTEVRAYLSKDFFDNYYSAKKKKGYLLENWTKYRPDIFIEPVVESQIIGRYMFFKPFRDFIKDAIYNSIWAFHGVLSSRNTAHSMVIKIKRGQSGILLEFRNKTKSENIILHPRNYHSNIANLGGDHYIGMDNDEFKLVLIIPYALGHIDGGEDENIDN